MSGFFATQRNLTDRHISGRSLSSEMSVIWGLRFGIGKVHLRQKTTVLPKFYQYKKAQRRANAIRSYRLRSDFAERWSVAVELKHLTMRPRRRNHAWDRQFSIMAQSG